MSLENALRKVTMGRIAYLIFAVIFPTAALLLSRASPGNDFMGGSVCLIGSPPVTLVGVLIVIVKKLQGEPILFWLIATLLGSVPTLVMIILWFRSQL